MSAIASLGYLRIESADTGAWREFGVKVLGMVEGRGPDPGAVYLRMDDFPARLVIVAGERDRLLASGWEVADEAAFDRVGRALDAAGVAVKAGTPASARARPTAASAAASATSQPEASSRSEDPGRMTRRAGKSSIRR